MLSSPCGEAERPTSVVGGKLRRRISPTSRIGPIKEIYIFNKEGSSGIDVKLPSAKHPEMLVWVSTLTDEVENCRQIAAISIVILKENQSNEKPDSTGEPATKGVTLKAKGDLEQEHLPIHERTWSGVPCPKDLPDNVHSGFSKRTAWLTRPAGKRERGEAQSWKESVGTIQKDKPNMIRGLTPYQTLGKLTIQTKQETYELYWKKKDQ